MAGYLYKPNVYPLRADNALADFYWLIQEAELLGTDPISLANAHPYWRTVARAIPQVKAKLAELQKK